MAVELDAVVAELVARSGAQAVRLVDARTGTVLADSGTVADDEVATLVRMARDAAPMARAGGGMEDLVLATRDAVHVLRSVPGGFLHIRLDSDRNVAAARRELASPALHRALDRVLVPASPPDLPRPRHSAEGPALAALGAAAPSARPGALAVLALSPDAPGHLPRRESSRPVPATTVLDQNWSLDVGTMQRLVAGLQRLN